MNDSGWSFPHNFFGKGTFRLENGKVAFVVSGDAIREEMQHSFQAFEEQLRLADEIARLTKKNEELQRLHTQQKRTMEDYRRSLAEKNREIERLMRQFPNGHTDDEDVIKTSPESSQIEQHVDLDVLYNNNAIPRSQLRSFLEEAYKIRDEGNMSLRMVFSALERLMDGRHTGENLFWARQECPCAPCREFYTARYGSRSQEKKFEGGEPNNGENGGTEPTSI